jgi:hypothetical protein
MLRIRPMIVVRPTLVIEIVQQRRNAPQILVRSGFSRVSANASFHGQRVLPQTLVLRVLAKQLPGIFPVDSHLASHYGTNPESVDYRSFRHLRVFMRHLGMPNRGKCP